MILIKIEKTILDVHSFTNLIALFILMKVIIYGCIYELWFFVLMFHWSLVSSIFCFDET